jgi:hypothetical protein
VPALAQTERADTLSVLSGEVDDQPARTRVEEALSRTWWGPPAPLPRSFLAGDEPPQEAIFSDYAAERAAMRAAGQARYQAARGALLPRCRPAHWRYRSC